MSWQWCQTDDISPKRNLRKDLFFSAVYSRKVSVPCKELKAKCKNITDTQNLSSLHSLVQSWCHNNLLLKTSTHFNQVSISERCWRELSLYLTPKQASHQNTVYLLLSNGEKHWQWDSSHLMQASIAAQTSFLDKNHPLPRLQSLNFSRRNLK